jgi:hypothetical protein
MLRKGSKNCPRDRKPLLWESLGGMRLIRQVGKAWQSLARCSHCHQLYDVRVSEPTP